MISPNPFQYSQNKRRRTSWYLQAFVALLAAAALVAVLFWQKPLSSFLWRISTPMLRLRNSFSGSEVETLKAALASTSAALADRDALYQQNIVLKKLLDRPQTSKQVLGAVLQRPPGLPYDMLLIDIGADHNLVPGDMVFAGGTTAVGDVREVYATNAKVSLFSSSGRTYDAQIMPKNGTGIVPLSLLGQGAGSLSGEVPAGSAVAIGDPVVIPGIGNTNLGSISHIDAPSGSSFETVFIQMPVNIFSLQYVEVQIHF